LLVFPNPAEDIINIHPPGQSNIKYWVITSVLQNEILKMQADQLLDSTINIQNLPKGVYFIYGISSMGEMIAYSSFTKQ
jgi:Secretion system C-terminal sorting domain